MKNSIAAIDRRHADILDVLKEKQHLTTQELAEALNVSLSTIRRDLHLLEEKNDIVRKYGYCTLNYADRDEVDPSGSEHLKKAIAREAGQFVHDCDTLFINASSTALKTVNYMHAEHVTIVTNNLEINHLPQNANYNYLLTGGEMRFPKEALVGDIALNTIAAINADTCIMGCSGVSLESGVTTEIINEGKINALMLDHTLKRKVLVADHRKIGVTSKCKVADISAFDYLITDQYASAETLKEIRKLGVKVIQVD